MRVTPPDVLKIDRNDLLRDVRERLDASAPAFAGSFDPTNPAWLLLQETAWLVERLSERLDQWPWASLQQFAHLIGTRVRPASPSLGVVVVDPAEAGVLDVGGNPARWRIFASRTEERGLVEFALAENGVSVEPLALGGTARLRDGELWSVEPSVSRGASREGSVVWFGDETRSDVFASEVFRYHVRAVDASRVEAELREAVDRLFATRDPGWLAIQVTRTDDANEVVVEARIDVSLPRATVVPGRDDDVVSPWQPLDDSVWTPPVRVSQHPLLPPNLRGTRPLRTSEGQLLVPGVPRNMLRNELLVRDARPAPSELPEVLWRTLLHLDRRLAGLQPAIRRGVLLEPTATLPWVDDALAGRAWDAVERVPDRTFAAVAIPPQPTARVLRFAWVIESGAALPAAGALARYEDVGLSTASLPCVPVWELDLPDPAGQGLLRVHAVDVEVPQGATGVVLSLDGRAVGLFANAVLVIDAPVIRDGRTTIVSRAVPEPISLLFEDVVTPGTIARLGASALPASVRRVVSAIPTAMFMVDGREPIADFAGVDIEPSEGVVTLHAPDANGRTRALRRGQEVELRWYRRTTGAAGNVPTGAIDFVEQAPTTRPRLVAVSNPLPSAWGEDRERADEAVQRVFGPQIGLPVTSADWERLVRIELGSVAESWVVRVWGYAERTMLSHALWPASPNVDEVRDRFVRELTTAGPDALVVVLGPKDAVLSEVQLDQARRVIESLVARWAERVPSVRRAVVSRLWALRADGLGDGTVPAYAPLGLSGQLVDVTGRVAPIPQVEVLLNAAVVGTR